MVPNSKLKQLKLQKRRERKQRQREQMERKSRKVGDTTVSGVSQVTTRSPVTEVANPTVCSAATGVTKTETPQKKWTLKGNV